MSHILARLRNVKFDLIESVLKADAPQHAKEGLFLKHLWQNADDSNEVLFLFQTGVSIGRDGLSTAFMERH